MQRIEAEIRSTQARIDADVQRVQVFIESWRDFVGMFTVTNARDKATAFLGGALGDVGEKAQGAFERAVAFFKRT